ncbi:MAG: hypothetical protein M3Z09_00960 [Acidobacteriota bacterium]|nr:hypothetical protein [Acidobacteriota bacterium]
MQQCVAGGPPDLDLARSLALDNCSAELFSIVAEGLADRFEPRLCDVYADVFSVILASVSPHYEAAELRDRYERIRQPRACRSSPERVAVLSRVTLGADIAVTSVLLDAAKQRFPHARIVLAGSAKTAGLFAADPRIEHLSVRYPRSGSFGERLDVTRKLAETINVPGTLVLDPDSRLTQLGLIPVCAEDHYFFFESRAYGGETAETLPQLAARWCEAVLQTPRARPFLALSPEPLSGPPPRIAVSFGVGENPAKRIAGPFEAGLLKYLGSLGGTLIIDQGAGGEEAERVDRALSESGVQAQRWTGSFAGFAALISQCGLYTGYDSAGQHAAAALGVPLVTVFSGHVSERMFQRWKPSGTGRIVCVKVEPSIPAEVLRQTIEAIEKIRRP